MEHVASLEGRKESSMPIRAGIFFEMFPFCILFEKDMIIKNMGGALRNCIPQMVGKKVQLSHFSLSSVNNLLLKVTEFWELIKPLVDFNYAVIETRMNSMFELATQVWSHFS